MRCSMTNPTNNDIRRCSVADVTARLPRRTSMAKAPESRDPTTLHLVFPKCRWRRDRDSNPGDGFPPTRVPGVRLRPLGHLSGACSLAASTHGMQVQTEGQEPGGLRISGVGQVSGPPQSSPPNGFGHESNDRWRVKPRFCQPIHEPEIRIAQPQPPGSPRERPGWQKCSVGQESRCT